MSKDTICDVLGKCSLYFSLENVHLFSCQNSLTGDKQHNRQRQSRLNSTDSSERSIYTLMLLDSGKYGHVELHLWPNSTCPRWNCTERKVHDKIDSIVDLCVLDCTDAKQEWTTRCRTGTTIKLKANNSNLGPYSIKAGSPNWVLIGPVVYKMLKLEKGPTTKNKLSNCIFDKLAQQKSRSRKH